MVNEESMLIRWKEVVKRYSTAEWATLTARKQLHAEKQCSWEVPFGKVNSVSDTAEMKSQVFFEIPRNFLF